MLLASDDGTYFWASHGAVDGEEPAAALVCCARVKPVKATRRLMAKLKERILSSADILDRE